MNLRDTVTRPEILDVWADIDPNAYGEHAAIGGERYSLDRHNTPGRHRATAASLLTVDDLRLTLCPITLERAIHIRTDRRLP